MLFLTLAALPAHAGHWSFTASGTMTRSESPAGTETPAAYAVPTTASLESFSLPAYTAST